jgi:hypothetical protein
MLPTSNVETHIGLVTVSRPAQVCKQAQVPHMCYTGTTQVPLVPLVPIGNTQAQLRYQTCTTQVPPKYPTGTVLVPPRYHSSTTLVQLEYHTGTRQNIANEQCRDLPRSVSSLNTCLGLVAQSITESLDLKVVQGHRERSCIPFSSDLRTNIICMYISKYILVGSAQS